jgi:hypothetical protein
MDRYISYSQSSTPGLSRGGVVLHQSSSDTATAFEARVKGRTLRFQAADADATALINLETRSTWDPFGLPSPDP